MVAFVLAVKTCRSDMPLALALLVVAAVGGWAFVARARARRRAGQEPLLDVELFAVPLFRWPRSPTPPRCSPSPACCSCSRSTCSWWPGLSPLQAGLLLVPGSIVTMVAGVGAARLARLAPFRVLVPAGLLLAAAGFVVAVLAAGVGAALAASVLIGAGIGLSETLTNDAILASAPAQRAGSASAVSETAYEVGAVLGTAVLGSVLGAAYARALDVPSSIGPVFAHDARETLGGAVALAGRIGGRRGAAAARRRDDRVRARVGGGVGGRRGGARRGRGHGGRRPAPALTRTTAAPAQTTCDRFRRMRVRGRSAGSPAAPAWSVVAVVGCVLTPRSDSLSWTSSEICDARRRSRIRMSTSIEMP